LLSKFVVILLFVSVGFGLFKTIEMLFVNVLGFLLQLDELTLECPLCEYRYE